MTFFDRVRSIVPELSHSLHKGQAGRILVIGGSFEYTGAPFYASVSTLKAGGDLAWVICRPEAAVPIKTYSPEIIVLPSLRRDNNEMRRAEDLLSRVHAVVIGPGLGRDEESFHVVEHLMSKAKALQLPMVVDGDGLYLVSQKPSLVQAYSKALLTPNKVEFSRLYKAVLGADVPVLEESTLETVRAQVDKKSLWSGGLVLDEASAAHQLCKASRDLSNALGNVAILQKGEFDVISDGMVSVLSTAYGSPRRCGGQGDVLAGTSGLFAHWAVSKQEGNPMILAAFGASTLTRNAARIAFEKHRRAMTTPDLIQSLPNAVEVLFPSKI